MEAEDRWLEGFQGPHTDGAVNSFAVVGNDLFVAGEFQVIGGLWSPGTAKWDGTRWSAVPEPGRFVMLAVFEGELYSTAAVYQEGDFVGRVARFDGSAWQEVGGGVPGTADGLVAAAHGLYVYGRFQNPGNTASTRVARWDGSAWQTLSDPPTSGQVTGLMAEGDDLYAIISSPDERPDLLHATTLMRWDGARWHQIAVLDAALSDIAIWYGQLYVAGHWIRSGDEYVANVQRFDGTEWVEVAGGADAPVTDLHSTPHGLYAAGWFARAGGFSCRGIARWDGQRWHPVGSGLVSNRVTMSELAGRLVVGGDFYSAGSGSVWHLAQWDGAAWKPIAEQGLDGFNWGAADFVVARGRLYAGGAFTWAGDEIADRVAYYDGDRWHGIGRGVDNTVFAVATDGASIYAGGAFTRAGGVDAHYVAQWDGKEWRALGSGMDDWVVDLAFRDGLLYAAGHFEHADGKEVHGVAVWDGAEWAPLGLGFNGPVFSLEFLQRRDSSATELYASGPFLRSGDTPLQRFAKWSGSAWQPAGALPGVAYVIRENGDLDFLGGNFGVLGWNGVGTISIEPWVRGDVFDVRAVAQQLYVTGDFLFAGDTASSSVMRWTEGAWSSMEGGVFGTGSALAVFDGKLFVGGDLTYAGGELTVSGGGYSLTGGKPSSGIAVWRLCPEAQPDCVASGPSTTSTTTTTITPPTSSTLSTSTTSVPVGDATCGDADRDGRVAAADALLTLRAVVGSAACNACLCDADGVSDVSAADALLLLRHAVGLPALLQCPAC